MDKTIEDLYSELKREIVKMNKIQEKIDRRKELLKYDHDTAIRCSTCKTEFNKNFAIIKTQCPHDNPYRPNYKTCRFCSSECRHKHVNAFDDM